MQGREVSGDWRGREAASAVAAGFGVIFRATRTTRRGRVLKAHDYGYRGWPMVVWVGLDNSAAG